MSNIFKNISMIISSSIVGLSLFFFTTKSGYYGDEESCIELRKYSHIWAIYELIMAGVYGSILVYTCIQNNLSLLQNQNESIKTIDVILTLVILFFVGNAIDKNEDCGSLLILVWVIIIIYICCVIIQCIVVCIVLSQLYK